MLWIDVMKGNTIYGAVWNDYAEGRLCNYEPGRVVIENGDDTLSLATSRLMPFAGVISDTYGNCLNYAPDQSKFYSPIAVAGRVLVYPYQTREQYHPGDCVCTAPNGTVDIMTREEIIQYPDRIVGIVSCIPEYEEWGNGASDRGPIKVDGRIWIKVK